MFFSWAYFLLWLAHLTGDGVEKWLKPLVQNAPGFLLFLSYI